MADDAGEKMLTLERLAEIESLRTRPMHRDDMFTLLAAAVRDLLDHIAALSATIKRLETERDRHLAFINMLADEQRPSGRIGDHPTDTARAAREHLK